jgi:hypothetical protein
MKHPADQRAAAQGMMHIDRENLRTMEMDNYCHLCVHWYSPIGIGSYYNFEKVKITPTGWFLC